HTQTIGGFFSFPSSRASILGFREFTLLLCRLVRVLQSTIHVTRTTVRSLCSGSSPFSFSWPSDFQRKKHQLVVALPGGVRQGYNCDSGRSGERPTNYSAELRQK